MTIAWALPTSYVETLLIEYHGLNIDTDHKNISVSGQTYIVVIRDLIPGETYIATATVLSGSESFASDHINRTMREFMVARSIMYLNISVGVDIIEMEK